MTMTREAPRRRTVSLKPSINWLLIFIPVSLGLEYAHAPAPVLFFSAALAIVPIAALIVRSTEQLATRTGDARRPAQRHVRQRTRADHRAGRAQGRVLDMVRASIIGAILAN
jgi:Ca2+:H+ antiporter